MNKKVIQYCNLHCQYFKYTVGECQEDFGVKIWCNCHKGNPRMLKDIRAEEYRKTKERILDASKGRDESEWFTDKLGDLEVEFIQSFRIKPPEWFPFKGERRNN